MAARARARTKDGLSATAYPSGVQGTPVGDRRDPDAAAVLAQGTPPG
ncbi:MAG: hypothetical protein WDN49_11700 [Acetobacteraceae bacterium]